MNHVGFTVLFGWWWVGGLSGFDSVKWSGGREAEIAAKDENGRLDLSDYDISSLFE